ncbi:hypothetical protein L7F22_035468 [Adiantum nelumboides]|nr:hypothetical protein [Adiantum nelumboides]
MDSLFVKSEPMPQMSSPIVVMGHCVDAIKGVHDVHVDEIEPHVPIEEEKDMANALATNHVEEMPIVLNVVEYEHEESVAKNVSCDEVSFGLCALDVDNSLTSRTMDVFGVALGHVLLDFMARSMVALVLYNGLCYICGLQQVYDACMVNKKQGTDCIVDDDDWGFDDPAVEMNEEMQPFVDAALERIWVMREQQSHEVVMNSSEAIHMYGREGGSDVCVGFDYGLANIEIERNLWDMFTMEFSSIADQPRTLSISKLSLSVLSHISFSSSQNSSSPSSGNTFHRDNFADRAHFSSAFLVLSHRHQISAIADFQPSFILQILSSFKIIIAFSGASKVLSISTVQSKANTSLAIERRALGGGFGTPFGVNVHNGVPQAVAKVKHGASFLVFDGKDGLGHTPYQVSSHNYTLQDHDCQIIDLLRSWSRSQPLNSGSSDYLVTISGIKEGSYFDLCCKIMAVYHQESSHVIILYVWDGTDAPPAYLAVSSATQGRDGNNQDPVAESRPEGLPPISREAVSTFPPLGTVLPVIPDIPIEELPLQLPTPGSWIKFRNLTCRIRNGIYEAVFVHESKISFLPPTSDLAAKCERNFQERTHDESGCLPQWASKPLHSITVTDYEHISFSTLRQILNHQQVTFKFRCLVRVISIFPSAIEEFCVQQSSSTFPSMLPNWQEGPPKAGYMYRLRLTLEDPTARINAYLCDVDAEHFFNGHPATDLHNASATKGALQRKVQELLGLEEYSSYGSSKSDIRYNPPWIKCCLKSYYLQKENPWETRRYKIFGTILA